MPKKARSKSKAKKSASRKPTRKKAIKKKVIARKKTVRKKTAGKKVIKKKIARKKASQEKQKAPNELPDWTLQEFVELMHGTFPPTRSQEACKTLIRAAHDYRMGGTFGPSALSQMMKDYLDANPNLIIPAIDITSG